MSKSLRALGAIISVGALLLGAGCGPSGENAGGPPPGQLSVLTAFYPLQFVTERVAGVHAAIESLTQPGAEPHDLELAPKQVAAVASADLVVYEKSFQPAVDEAVTNNGVENALDITTVVPLAEVNGHEHDHDEHDHDHEHDQHTHDHGGHDPHVWLDPTNMVTIAEAVAEELTRIDPDHADDYQANFEALTGELTTLDEELTQGLASCERTEFITSHAAFGYLAKRYGLTQIAIAGLSPEDEPSPARIAEIHEEAEAHGVTTIFYETLVSPAVAESVASDLKLKTDVLDPIEGITDKSRGKDYLAVMASNLDALQKANGCS